MAGLDDAVPPEDGKVTTLVIWRTNWPPFATVPARPPALVSEPLELAVSYSVSAWRSAGRLRLRQSTRRLQKRRITRHLWFS